MTAALLCAVLAFTPAKGAERVEKSVDFADAVNGWRSRGQPAAEAIRLLGQVNAALQRKANDDAYRDGVDTHLLGIRFTLFDSACRKASDEELRSLAAMIPDLVIDAPGSLHADFQFEECVIAYGTAQIEHAVSKFKGRPAKVKMPSSKAAPPPELAIAPEGLRAAWQAWQCAIEPYLRLKDAAVSGPAIANEITGPGSAVAYLKTAGPTPPPGLWRQLIRQEARAAHGNGQANDESTRRARHRAIVLSLLAEGRLQEAVGAMCVQLAAEEGYPVDPSRKTYAALTREFLISQGLDWEQIYLGFLLTERAPKAGNPASGALGNTEAWVMLSAIGSGPGVQLGLDWINHAKMGSEDGRPFLLQALGPGPRANKNAADPRPKRVQALPENVRARAIGLLASYVDRAQPVVLLNRTLEAIPEWLTKDLELHLKALLTHESSVIAARAFWLLRTAGLIAADTKITQPNPPIRIRVMVDGAPFANASVTVQGNGLNTRITTTPDGELVIPLNASLQAKAIDSVYISSAPAPQSPALPGKLLQSVPSLRNEGANHGGEGADGKLPQPWFAVAVPVKAGDSAVKDVAIQTGELEVGLKGSPGVPADVPVNVTLVRDGGVNRASQVVQSTGKPGESLLFQRLQVGRYRMMVRSETTVAKPFQEVHVTKLGSLKLVELEAGRAVRAQFGGAWAPERITTIAKLFRDGVQVKGTLHNRGARWDGLPLGKYKLRIPSSTELENAVRIRALAQPPGSKPQRHAAREVEFELTPDSPTVVDLGVIELKPEEGEETK